MSVFAGSLFALEIALNASVYIITPPRRERETHFRLESTWPESVRSGGRRRGSGGRKELVCMAFECIIIAHGVGESFSFCKLAQESRNDLTMWCG